MKKSCFKALFLAFGLMVMTTTAWGCKDNKSGNSEKENVSENANENESANETLKAKDFPVVTENQEVQDAQEAPEEQEVQQNKQPAKPKVYSTADDGFLNIREMPVPGSKIVGKLMTGGEGAEYLGSTSTWHNVKFHGVEGYVNGKYAELRGLEELSTNVPEAKGRKVYYVVLGSYTDLAKAKKSTEVLPDALDGSCIYRATEKGKTVYRLCLDCFYSREEAQKLTKSTNDFFGRNSWVWESQGLAPCVYQGISPNGEPARMTPKK